MFSRVLFVVAGVAISATANAQHSFVDLGPGWGLTINAQGQIGGSRPKNVAGYEIPHAFIWSEDSGFFEPFSHSNPYSPGSYVAALNSHGHFVGVTELTGYRVDHLGFHEAIPRRSPGGYHTMVVSDINDQRYAVGSFMRDVVMIAFYWDPEYWKTNKVFEWNLQEIAEFAVASGINNRNQVAGHISITDNWRAFVWSEATGLELVGPISEGTNEVADINDSGQVVGAAMSRGWIWNPSTNETIWLGTLGGNMSIPTAINSHGWVVGHSQTTTGTTSAFLWTPEDGMIDLGSLVGLSGNSYAYDINDHGQIVGSWDVNGQSHIGIWNPIPEPGTGAVLGALSLLAIRRRRKM